MAAVGRRPAGVAGDRASAQDETYTDLAVGFAVGAMAPTLDQAMAVADGKAYVILDGSPLRIDRVAMASGADRAYYSGKHKCHGVNVEVLADPAGRPIWVSPALPGARHDMGATGHHDIPHALQAALVNALADTAPDRQSRCRTRAAARTPTPAHTARTMIGPGRLSRWS